MLWHSIINQTLPSKYAPSATNYHLRFRTLPQSGFGRPMHYSAYENYAFSSSFTPVWSLHPVAPQYAILHITDQSSYNRGTWFNLRAPARGSRQTTQSGRREQGCVDRTMQYQKRPRSKRIDVHQMHPMRTKFQISSIGLCTCWRLVSSMIGRGRAGWEYINLSRHQPVRPRHSLEALRHRSQS